MKELLNKSLKWHFSALIVSMAIVSSIIAFVFVSIAKEGAQTKEQLAAKYTRFPFKSYYYMYQNDHNEAFHALKSTLEGGGIALFGSSELTSNKSRFTPYVFFPEVLGSNLTAYGHAGFQDKAVTTQILSVITPEVLENGRVVILLSPSWYQSGEGMHEGLWRKEVASKVIISRIRENKFVSEDFKKRLLGSEVKSIFGGIDDRLREYVDRKFLETPEKKPRRQLVKAQSFEWDAWKKEALNFEKSISSNEYEINDEYFNLHMRPLIEESKFPLSISVHGTIEDNVEIQDFLLLLDVVEKFKNKPLFVILPLSRKAYRNLEVLDPTVSYLEKKINEKKYPLLNFWTMPHQQGVLTDVMHTGAYGWMLINEFIYLHQDEKQ